MRAGRVASRVSGSAVVIARHDGIWRGRAGDDLNAMLASGETHRAPEVEQIRFPTGSVIWLLASETPVMVLLTLVLIVQGVQAPVDAVPPAVPLAF